MVLGSLLSGVTVSSQKGSYAHDYWFMDICKPQRSLRAKPLDLEAERRYLGRSHVQAFLEKARLSCSSAPLEPRTGSASPPWKLKKRGFPRFSVHRLDTGRGQLSIAHKVVLAQWMVTCPASWEPILDWRGFLSSSSPTPLLEDRTRFVFSLWSFIPCCFPKISLFVPQFSCQWNASNVMDCSRKKELTYVND